jgi:preprotein translocase subunit SecE
MNDASDIVDTQPATQPDGTEPEESLAAPRTLGMARWVQYVFVVVAAFLFWFLDKMTVIIWSNFAEPIEGVSTVASALVGGVVALRFYKHDTSRRLVTEIVAELSKVTWPSRKETYASSIVVIITSVIMAMIVGSFDFVWSTITDLLYKYKV